MFCRGSSSTFHQLSFLCFFEHDIIYFSLHFQVLQSSIIVIIISTIFLFKSVFALFSFTVMQSLQFLLLQSNIIVINCGNAYTSVCFHISIWFLIRFSHFNLVSHLMFSRSVFKNSTVYLPSPPSIVQVAEIVLFIKHFRFNVLLLYKHQR